MGDELDRGHRGRSWVRTAGQAVGFGLGLGLLGWVVYAASRELTPDKIEQLRSAEPWRVGLIMALAAVSVGLNGLCWWVAVRPVRPVPAGDCVAVNAVASALALLPFKLSVVFRTVIHRSRHGVPVLMFGGWSVAVAAVLLATLGPPVVVSLALEGGTAVWWLAAVGGSLAALLVVVVLARCFSTGAGWAALSRLVMKFFGRRGATVIASPAFENAHRGVFMLADSRSTLLGGVIRLSDVVAVAARFWLAAELVGTPISLGEACVVAVSYFVISASAPTGSAGAREAGAAGVFVLLKIEDPALIVAFVGLVELVIGLVAGGFGAIALGPRTMFAARTFTDAPAAELRFAAVVRSGSREYAVVSDTPEDQHDTHDLGGGSRQPRRSRPRSSG